MVRVAPSFLTHGVERPQSRPHWPARRPRRPCSASPCSPTSVTHSLTDTCGFHHISRWYLWFTHFH